MPASKEYLQKAEECYRLANEAKTEADRLACLDLARSWLDASLSEVATASHLPRARRRTSSGMSRRQKPDPRVGDGG